MIRPRILLLSNDPPIADQVIENLDPRFFNVHYVLEMDFKLFKRIFFEFRPHMVIDRVKISALSAGDKVHNELIGDFLWRYDGSHELYRHIPILMIFTLDPLSKILHVDMGANERVNEDACSDKEEFPLWVRMTLRKGSLIRTHHAKSFGCPECGSIHVQADVMLESSKMVSKMELYGIDGWFEVPRYQICADCSSPIPAHLGENWFHLSPDELRAEWQEKFRDAEDRPDARNIRIQKIPKPLTAGQYAAFDAAWKAR